MTTIYYSHGFTGRIIKDVLRESESIAKVMRYFESNWELQLLDPIRGHLEMMPAEGLEMEWAAAHRKYQNELLFPHTTRDMEDIFSCQGLLIDGVSTGGKLSTGCVMEIAWGMAAKIPIVVLLPPTMQKRDLHIIVKQNVEVDYSFHSAMLRLIDLTNAKKIEAP